MTPDIEREPHGPAHNKVLEEKHVTTDHVLDVLQIYQCIVAIGRAGIEREKFQEDTPGRETVEAIIAEARHFL